MAPLYSETNLIGYLTAGITSTASTITANFFDKVTGLARVPDAATLLFVIDKGSPTLPNPNYEIILATSHTTSGAGVTTITVAARGLAFSGASLAAGTGKAHVANAEIGCVDVHYYNSLNASILLGTTAMANDLNMGTNKITNLEAPTADTDAATMKYVNDTAIAGAPDAGSTTKGITKLSVAPVSATDPIAIGDNDPRLTSSSGTLSATNKIMSQEAYQKGAEIYAASTTGNDTYVITLTPAPAGYVVGMIINFMPDTDNTGAATIKVNGLDAKTINKVSAGVAATLENGDIQAGFIYSLAYTGTYFVLQNPTGNTMSTANSATLTAGPSSNATSLHMHDTVYSIYVSSASDNLKASIDTELIVSNDSRNLRAVTGIYFTGSVRLKYDLMTTQTPDSVKLTHNSYVSTIADITESVSGSYVTKTHDINVAPGDSLVLVVTQTSGDNIYVRNFRLYYDIAAHTVTVPSVA